MDRDIKQVVRDKYGEAARRSVGEQQSRCCDPIYSNLYDTEQTKDLAKTAVVASRYSQEVQMLTKKDANEFASHWVKAWNSHDLDEIMLHYSTDIVLVSPFAAKILNDPSGILRGSETLREYFRRGLEVYPNLKFELIDVMWGVSSFVLYYVNQKGTKTGEFMEIDADVRVTRVVANYSD